MYEEIVEDAAHASLREEQPDIFDLPVHPVADSFGMMTDDELEELADARSAAANEQPRRPRVQAAGAGRTGPTDHLPRPAAYVRLAVVESG